MKVDIFSQKTFLGSTNLELIDENMGVFEGTFFPEKSYFENFQKKVWKHNHQKFSGRVDYKVWDALRLNVQMENGSFLFPRGGYEIDDYQELKEEPIRFRIAGVVTDFFNSSSLFKGKWRAMDISEKISLEDELEKELREDHLLFDAQVSAHSRTDQSDDVLFEINSKKLLQKFAVVHLSWIGKKETDSCFPTTSFYDNFEEFAENELQQ